MLYALPLNHGRQMTTNTTSSIPSPEVIQETATIQDEQGMSVAWILTILVVLVVIALFLLGIYFSNFNGHWGNQGDFGTFGDFLGGTLNPILGFATVVLLIRSLKLQSIDLVISRRELVQSNDAMQRQVSHLEKETKLNELIRLMDDLRSQFHKKLMLILQSVMIYFGFITLPSQTVKLTTKS